ncbi:MAG: 16S rRNA (cytidine(1402)-2'-O)-methyltransferase [Sorangiineae bacterium]|nr:16S rRNA (cytidine(1402)-2'-O)-methyltransferase [Polyangiaceae bacterium]MEB2324578.1 16S rRNA (cytidine(1402)-2'-O)-methyltransferase [Sorangiineae bacterium]
MSERGPLLFIVGTPIGNLGDLTLRAVETLREVEHVAAEDTRRTRALLSHLGIHGKTLHSLDANASPEKVERLVERLAAGERVALVTDAGMPGVSDPGAALVRRATEREVPMTVVPGPSALTAAVALSGLVEGPFLFLGFLPRAGPKRRALLERLHASGEAVVLFESPNRTQATLAELAERNPERAACVCRELTKLYEETTRGSLRELAGATRDWRGEIVIVLAPWSAPRPVELDATLLESRIGARLAAGASVRTVADELLAESGLPRRELYARVLREQERRAHPGASER